ncbi:MAG: hypothetical protein Q9218_007709 [Villophora microphyllina]
MEVVRALTFENLAFHRNPSYAPPPEVTGTYVGNELLFGKPEYILCYTIEQSPYIVVPANHFAYYPHPRHHHRPSSNVYGRLPHLPYRNAPSRLIAQVSEVPPECSTMPGSEGVAGGSAESSPEAWPPPEEQPPKNGNGQDPFSTDVLDEESLTTGSSEPPKSFGDRFKHLIKLRKPASDASSEFTGDAERDQLIKSLDQYVVGYPKVAAYENSDPNFLIYRKFGWLHNRILLYLQDELADLEYRLEKLDKRTFSDENDTQLKSRRLDFADSPTRRTLVKQITERLEVYDEHLLRFQKVQAIRRPTIRNQKSLFNFIRNTDSLVDEEYEWIKEGVDLAALALEGEHGWFNGFLEDTLNRISKKATLAVFRTKEQRIITGHEDVSLISPYRLDILLRIVLTILAAVLLLVPVIILFELQPTHRQDVRRNCWFQILTIFVFTLIFSASCSVFTKARRQEVFTATAAYCAVLVVFLGNTMNVLTGGK